MLTIILGAGNSTGGSCSINKLMDTAYYIPACFKDILVCSELEYILSQSSLKVYCDFELLYYSEGNL